jgi:hypothetical protein
VLLIVGDGEDNESRKTLEDARRMLQEAGNPLIYAIALPHANPNERVTSGRRALEMLTIPSGGATIPAENPGELRKAALKIAEELRSQYSITYASANLGNAQIRVVARSAAHKDLTVRVNSASVPDIISRPSAVVSAPVAPPTRSVAAPLAAAPPLGPDCISGTVVDEDQKPLARIFVEALPAFGPRQNPRAPNPYSITDAHGHFRLSGLEKGNYRLFTRPEAYSRQDGVFYRNPDQTPVESSESCANVTLNFITRFATLEIRVIDAATRQPIPEYGITLRNAQGAAYSFPRVDPALGLHVPPRMQLSIQAYTPQRIRSTPMTLTTPEAGTSQQVTIEFDQHLQPSAKENNP